MQRKAMRHYYIQGHVIHRGFFGNSLEPFAVVVSFSGSEILNTATLRAKVKDEIPTTDPIEITKITKL